MLGDGLDTPGTWEKCRMTLVKAAGGSGWHFCSNDRQYLHPRDDRHLGGFMLEFFSPPKTSKPKTGVFCISINEVRSALEMLDACVDDVDVHIDIDDDHGDDVHVVALIVINNKARETTALEMPDKEATFVLRVSIALHSLYIQLL